MVQLFRNSYTRFDIADDHISVEVNIDDAEAKVSAEKQDIYGCILQMYYDKIDVKVIGVEQRTKISNVLNATKEIFESFCGKGVSFDTQTIDKLL